MRFHLRLCLLPAVLIMPLLSRSPGPIVAQNTAAQNPAPQNAPAQPTPAAQPTPDAVQVMQHVHDPCIIKEGSYFYVFSTGPGLPMRRSKDLISWEHIGRAFKDDVPSWAKREIPQSNALWAPDVAFLNGRFRLYYSVSSFGRNRSIIGVASNTTLDPARKDYKWVDEGKVVESLPHDDFNAIDPNLIVAGPDSIALSFGSFWSGIKLISLDAATGKPARGALLISLARRPPPDAIEAPFIIRRGEYFYLFVSFDFCCRGAASTYNIRVGRSNRVAGPYTDRDGKLLLDGGGTPVLATQGKMIGPGHCNVLQDAGGDFLVHHFYDGDRNGIPTLQVRPLTWTADGWPVAGAPLSERRQ